MDDMTNDIGQPVESNPQPLMPLSMPTAPDDRGGPQDPPTLPNQPTAEFVPLMPLSMPTSGATGGSLPPQGPGGWVPWELSAQPPEPPHRPSSSRRITAVLLAVALLAAAVGAAVGAALSSSSPSNPSSIAPLPNTPAPTLPSQKSSTLVTTVSAAVLPAIVDIQTTIATETGTTTEQAAGTGMIITPSGEVLTNNHVVDDATSIKVTIQGRSGSFDATVLGVDPPETSDVALLQIQGVSDLPYVHFGDSATVAVGQPVVAIGNALGLEGTPSVVSGIVSALGRTITASDGSVSTTETLHNLIQTDAPIVPGDSGGPLINASGQVIGMDTAASTAQGSSATLGFALPINTVRSIVTKIEHRSATGGVILGESAFLGIFEQASTGTNSGNGFGFGFGFGNTGNTGNTGTQVPGVTIAGVAANSPASLAGLGTGDVITSIAGKKITTWAELSAAVGAYHPGNSVAISFVDSTGVPHNVTLVLAGIPK